MWKSTCFLGCLIVVLAGCGTKEESTLPQVTNEAEQMAERTIDSVLADHTDHLMTLPDVVGVGVGECAGIPCIKVFAARPSTALQEQLPDSLEGYLVEIEVTGEFKADDSIR
jgi:hypothetical protein